MKRFSHKGSETTIRVHTLGNKCYGSRCYTIKAIFRGDDGSRNTSVADVGNKSADSDINNNDAKTPTMPARTYCLEFHGPQTPDEFDAVAKYAINEMKKMALTPSSNRPFERKSAKSK